MLYTIGHTESYEKILNDYKVKGGEKPWKLGKTDQYIGGIVFKSIPEAEEYLRKTGQFKRFSVYGLVTNHKNVYEHPDAKTLHIIEGCEIVPLPK